MVENVASGGIYCAVQPLQMPGANFRCRPPKERLVADVPGPFIAG